MAKRLTLTDFISPENEISVLKGVPNTKYWHDVVYKALDKMHAEVVLCAQDFQVRKRYRGPRWHNVRDCRKEDGWSFSLYIDDPVQVKRSFDDAVLILANEIESNGATFIHLKSTHGHITFGQWLDDTKQNFSWEEIVADYPNLEWYDVYRDELERYFIHENQLKQGSYRYMFVNFIREKH